MKMLSVSSNNLCSKRSASSVNNSSDLLIEILYRLPLQTLCAFKTVSKQWLSLISDPCFERKFNLRSRRHSMPALFMKKQLRNQEGVMESDFETLVMDEQKGTSYVRFKTPIAINDNTSICIRQSCNGLVLCQFHDGPNGYRRGAYVIYNPSMKHCKTILPSRPFSKTPIPYVQSATIAFDPAKSSYYEVVGVCSADPFKNMYHIEIYSSKTDSWRDAGDPFPMSQPGFFLYVAGVYWNGSVHWIDDWTATLYYYDIDCELMKTIAMPTQPYFKGDSGLQIVYFKECRGHIHLMELTRKDDDIPRCDIWEMRMDYSGWNVKYFVDLSPLTTVYPRIVTDDVGFRCFALNVMLIEEGEYSSRLILRIANEKVISLDLKDQSFKEMYDVKPDVHVRGFEYIEILAHA